MFSLLLSDTAFSVGRARLVLFSSQHRRVFCLYTDFLCLHPFFLLKLGPLGPLLLTTPTFSKPHTTFKFVFSLRIGCVDSGLSPTLKTQPKKALMAFRHCVRKIIWLLISFCGSSLGLSSSPGRVVFSIFQARTHAHTVPASLCSFCSKDACQHYSSEDRSCSLGSVPGKVFFTKQMDSFSLPGILNYAADFLFLNQLLGSLEPSVYKNSIPGFIFYIQVPMLLFLHLLCFTSRLCVFSKQPKIFLEQGPENK